MSLSFALLLRWNHLQAMCLTVLFLLFLCSRNEDCQRMNTATFDASPYTHVVYSFASIDSSYRLEAWDGTFENEVPLYREFNSVKQRHPGIKTMIAVGG